MEFCQSRTRLQFQRTINFQIGQAAGIIYHQRPASRGQITQQADVQRAAQINFRKRARYGQRHRARNCGRQCSKSGEGRKAVNADVESADGLRRRRERGLRVIVRRAIRQRDGLRRRGCRRCRGRQRIAGRIRKPNRERTTVRFNRDISRRLHQEHHRDGRRGVTGVNVRVKERVEADARAKRGRAGHKNLNIAGMSRINLNRDIARNRERFARQIGIVKRDARFDDKRLTVGCREIRAAAARRILRHGLIAQLHLPFADGNAGWRKVNARQIRRLAGRRNGVVENDTAAKPADGQSGVWLNNQRNFRAQINCQWSERGESNVNLHAAHARNHRATGHAHIHDGVLDDGIGIHCHDCFGHAAIGVGGQRRHRAVGIDDLIFGVELHNSQYKAGIYFQTKQRATDAAAHAADAGDGKLSGFKLADVDDRIRDFATHRHATRQTGNGIDVGRKDQNELFRMIRKIRPLDFKLGNLEAEPSRQVQLSRRHGDGETEACILVQLDAGTRFDQREISCRAGGAQSRADIQGGGGRTNRQISAAINRRGVDTDVGRAD